MPVNNRGRDVPAPSPHGWPCEGKEHPVGTLDVHTLLGRRVFFRVGLSVTLGSPLQKPRGKRVEWAPAGTAHLDVT